MYLSCVHRKNRQKKYRFIKFLYYNFMLNRNSKINTGVKFNKKFFIQVNKY